MSSFATAVGVGLLGVLAGVPARAVIQRLAGPPAAAQAGWRWPGIAPAMGLLWFAVTRRLAGQGLGWAVPAYLALAFVCLVLAVIDAATRLLPNRITYPAFPVVAGLLVAASLGLGELGRLGRGLLAAASVGGLFLLLALLSPHGMGVGDVLTELLGDLGRVTAHLDQGERGALGTEDTPTALGLGVRCPARLTAAPGSSPITGCPLGCGVVSTGLQLSSSYSTV
jgi:type IV leader peptidase family protein